MQAARLARSTYSAVNRQAFNRTLSLSSATKIASSQIRFRSSAATAEASSSRYFSYLFFFYFFFPLAFHSTYCLLLLLCATSDKTLHTNQLISSIQQIK
jgi:hypothetical protein